MNYHNLSINQKINIKANSLVHYHRMNLKYVLRSDPGIFSPTDRMLLEIPGSNNNRNYDGPVNPYAGAINY